MDGFWVFFFIFWFLGFAGLSAAVASSKGRNALAWFVVGGIFGIFGLVAALAVQPDRRRMAARDGLVKCPFCIEWIQPVAKVCRYCGRDLVPAHAESADAYDVVLISAKRKRGHVTAEISDSSDISLQYARQLVRSTPATVMWQTTKLEAQRLADALAEFGAVVEIHQTGQWRPSDPD